MALYNCSIDMGFNRCTDRTMLKAIKLKILTRKLFSFAFDQIYFITKNLDMDGNKSMWINSLCLFTW